MSLTAIFGLFGSGIIAGCFLSGLPWAVGYIIRSFKKIVMM